MDLTGDPAGEPQKVGVAYADIFTGVYAEIAILAALSAPRPDRRRRDHRHGAARLQVSVLANQAINYLVSGVSPQRLGNAHPNIAPYQTFPVADGHLIVAVGNDGQFAKLCAELGCPELAADPRFASNPARVQHREALAAALTLRVSARTRDELLARLARLGVPAGPINRVDQVFADPQVVARALQVRSEGQGHTVPGVASPIVIDGERMVAAQASPRLGGSGPTSAWSART